MYKKIFVFLLFCLFAINNNHARPLSQPGRSSFIVVLKEPSLSRSAFDERGNSLYKGISKRKNRRVEHVKKHRMRLQKNLSNFENRLRKLSPDIIPRRRFTGLINGISLEMPGRIAPRIRSLPEVLAIVPNRKYNRLLNLNLWRCVGYAHIPSNRLKWGKVQPVHCLFRHYLIIIPGKMYPQKLKLK